MEKKPLSVFVSYARNDSGPFVTMLINKLKEAELEIWVDKENIPPGGVIRKEIHEGIHNCDVMLAVQSKESLENSIYSQGEWAYALREGKWIIPIFKGDEAIQIHPSLKHVLGIQIKDDKDPALDDLVKYIRGDHIPQAYQTQSVVDSGALHEFPMFYNQDKGDYGALIETTQKLYFASSTGHQFIPKYETQLESVIRRKDSAFQFMLVRPTETAVRHIAFSSGWGWENSDLPQINEAYTRILDQISSSIKTLRRLYKVGGERVQIRMIDRFAPVPLIMADPDATYGRIIFGIYGFGTSTDHKVLRPGTVLRKNIAQELYEHFYTVFQNMWQSAHPTTAEELAKLHAQIPTDYDFDRPAWE